VCRPPRATFLALTAGDIDLAHHGLADAPRRVRRSRDLTDELMPQHPLKRCVAPQQFQVRRAHPGESQPHQCLPGSRSRRRYIVAYDWVTIKPKCFHRIFTISSHLTWAQRIIDESCVLVGDFRGIVAWQRNRAERAS
jgi:hypothetical protein